MFKKVFSILLDFLYPKELSVLELESLNAGNLLTKLLPAKDLGEDVIAVWNYADPSVRTLIWEIKYRRNEKLVDSTAQVLFDVLKTELADRVLFDNFVNPLLIPIPVSKKRRLERGYNQVELLCEAVKKLDTENILDYEPNVLEKVVETESQARTKNKKNRLENIKNTMKATQSAKNRNIILIDDVTTTGATLGDARRALREAGAKKILCLTLAH